MNSSRGLGAIAPREIGAVFHTEREMKNPAYNCCIEPRRPQLEDPPPRREPLPCTEEFIANGGDYERLDSQRKPA